MAAEKQVDYDCWQYHIGILTGTLRALGAGVETMSSIEWMKQQLETDMSGGGIDRLIDAAGLNDTGGKPKRPKGDDYDADGFYTGKKIERPPVEKPVKAEKPTKDNGIAASEPPKNSLGLSDWEPDKRPDGLGTVSPPADDDDDQDEGEEATGGGTTAPEAKSPRGWTAEQEQVVIQAVRDGKSPAAIALLTGKGYQTAYSKIAALKAAGRC